jgi:hypothetical protein
MSVKYHCDRCDRTTPVKWTGGKESGNPILPEHWSRIAVPILEDQPTSEQAYVICDQCNHRLHRWLNTKPSEDERMEDEQREMVGALPQAP